MASNEQLTNAVCFFLAWILTIVSFVSYTLESVGEQPLIIIFLCGLAVFLIWFKLLLVLSNKIIN